MKCTLKTEQVAVFDDLFEPDRFRHFVQFFNTLDFRFRHSEGWFKVWKISDGSILSGKELQASRAPFNSGMDWVHYMVTALAQSHAKDICGEFGKDYHEVIYTPYVYPVGTRISWHDDHGYSAACIFYCHPVWHPEWGGELQLAKTDEFSECVEDPLDDQVQRKYIPKLLNKHGYGTYISPLPNRMVFTKGGVWHAINRVDKIAGDSARHSVVAFFRKRDEPKPASLAPPPCQET